MELVHEVRNGVFEGENKAATGCKGVWQRVPHRGLQDTSVFEQLRHAARRMIFENYVDFLLPQEPITRITPTKCKRNEEIRSRHRRGETLVSLAEVFGLSENRVWQIIHGRRK